MGCSKYPFKVITELRRKGVFAGVKRVFDLGAQHIGLRGDYQPAVEFLEAFGVTDLRPGEVEALVKRRFMKHLWERAGITYFALDFDQQFQTLHLDLNYDDLPPAFRNRFDLTINLGTTEHVVNQLNSFKIVHDLTAPGGYMMHDLPWSGHFNHGLINYKPHLFWRLCQSNLYNWTGMWLRGETNERLNLPENIVTWCSDKETDFYRQFFAFDGLMTVVLQKAYDMPFVCPLDMEEKAVLDGAARGRYWTLVEPDPASRVPVYRDQGFPNDPRTASSGRGY
jgi:hypothetical protein